MQNLWPANKLAAAFPGCTCGLHQLVPCFYACLPLTELQAGNKQFVYDLEGHIYIASGDSSCVVLHSTFGIHPYG